MSFFGMNIAGSALDAYQAAANVTSDNIANVNTPGASRQQAIFNEASPIPGSPGYIAHSKPGTFGDGVLMQSVLRVHADSYDTLFRAASSSQNFYSVQKDQLNATQATFSEPTGGINAAFTAFQQSIQSLQSDPGNPDQRAGVLSAAQGLVNSITTTGQSIQNQLATVYQQSQALVTQINGMSDQIAALNGQIRASTAIGDNPNTYKDQRDQLIDKLSQMLSTQTAIQANGSTLVTVNGRALVNDTVAYHLAAPIVGTNPNGTPTLKVGFTTDPNPLNPTPVPLGQGQLAGLVDLYNNKLMPYSTRLDAFTNALAFEVNRITQSSYDQNGVPGTALLQPVVASKAISASNVKVGITQPSQVTAALATTAAGTIVNAINADNQVVDTSQNIVGSAALANAPAAAFAGTLTVNVDGVNRTFAYNLAGNAQTIDAFVTNFNTAHIGVTVSYDSVGQKVIFARDPMNEDAFMRTQPNYAPTPSFSITDSNTPQAGLKGSLLGILGAAGLQNSPNGETTGAVAAGATQLAISNPTRFAVGQTIRIDDTKASAENVTITAINGNVLTVTPFANAHASAAQVFVTSTAATGVVQDNTDAFGSSDNSAAIALAQLFNQNVGVPGLSTYAATFVPTSPFVATPGATTTVTEQVPGGLSEFGLISVGQSLTFINNLNQSANLVVTAINRITGTVTGTVTSTSTGAPVTFQPTPVGLGPPYTAIVATQAQTLSQYYGSLVTQLGLDSQTAITGTATQTALANNINTVRQGIDGISLDEESQNLIKYQSAYQAAAKTVSAMDTMLQTILALGGSATAAF